MMGPTSKLEEPPPLHNSRVHVYILELEAGMANCRRRRKDK